MALGDHYHFTHECVGPSDRDKVLLAGGGGVLPPCDFACQTFDQGTTIYADTWTFAPNLVAVTFSLRDFIQLYGAGVYTVYLITGNDTSSANTSISVFVG